MLCDEIGTDVPIMTRLEPADEGATPSEFGIARRTGIVPDAVEPRIALLCGEYLEEGFAGALLAPCPDILTAGV